MPLTRVPDISRFLRVGVKTTRGNAQGILLLWFGSQQRRSSTLLVGTFSHHCQGSYEGNHDHGPQKELSHGLQNICPVALWLPFNKTPTRAPSKQAAKCEDCFPARFPLSIPGLLEGESSTARQMKGSGWVKVWPLGLEGALGKINGLEHRPCQRKVFKHEDPFSAQRQN